MGTHIKAITDARVGLRVRVIGPGHYRGACEGQYGTIRACWGEDSIAVDLDFKANPNSGRGYYYFKYSELEVLNTENTETATAEEKGETTMQNLTNYVNVAKVHFLNDTTAFRTIECANYCTELIVGDLCVVKTANHGMGLAEVDEISTRPEKELTREVVARVDTSDYDTRVEQRKQLAELKTKMQERAKKLQDIALFSMLAKEDPEMAQLLQQYQGLGL